MVDQVKISQLLILYNICYGLVPIDSNEPVKTNKQFDETRYVN